MGKVLEKWIALIIIVFVPIGFFAALFCLAALLDMSSCQSQAKKMGLAWSYGPLQGCMVAEADGSRWFPIDRYRMIEEKK